MFSGPCQTPRKQANARKEHPRLGASDHFLEIFREPPAAVEPSNCPLDHPSPRLRLECTNALGACDYLNGPLPALRERFEQLLSAVDAVSKDVTQLGKDEADIFQQRYRAVDVLDIGGMHLHGKQ